MITIGRSVASSLDRSIVPSSIASLVIIFNLLYVDPCRCFRPVSIPSQLLVIPGCAGMGNKFFVFGFNFVFLDQL